MLSRLVRPSAVRRVTYSTVGWWNLLPARVLRGGGRYQAQSS